MHVGNGESFVGAPQSPWEAEGAVSSIWADVGARSRPLASGRGRAFSSRWGFVFNERFRMPFSFFFLLIKEGSSQLTRD